MRDRRGSSSSCGACSLGNCGTIHVLLTCPGEHGLHYIVAYGTLRRRFLPGEKRCACSMRHMHAVYTLHTCATTCVLTIPKRFTCGCESQPRQSGRRCCGALSSTSSQTSAPAARSLWWARPSRTSAFCAATRAPTDPRAPPLRARYLGARPRCPGCSRAGTRRSRGSGCRRLRRRGRSRRTRSCRCGRMRPRWPRLGCDAGCVSVLMHESASVLQSWLLSVSRSVQLVGGQTFSWLGCLWLQPSLLVVGLQISAREASRTSESLLQAGPVSITSISTRTKNCKPLNTVPLPK